MSYFCLIDLGVPNASASSARRVEERVEQASIVNPTSDYSYDLAQAEVEVSPTTNNNNSSSPSGLYASGVKEESRGRSSTKSTVSILLICALYWTVYVYIYYSMYYN